MYHTGPTTDGPGEVRKVRLATLRRSIRSPRWRPLAANAALRRRLPAGRPAHIMTARPRNRCAAALLAAARDSALAAAASVRRTPPRRTRSARPSRSRPARCSRRRDAPHFYLTFRQLPLARLPRLQGARSVRVLRRPARSAPVRHRRSRRGAAGTSRGSSGSPTGSARQRATCATSCARRPAASTARSRRAAADTDADRAARHAERQHLRAGAAAQPRSAGHLVARAAARTIAIPSCGASRSTVHRARRLRGRGRARTPARLHGRHRLGRRRGHQDVARPDAALRGEPLHRRAGRRRARCACWRRSSRSRQGPTSADGVFDGDAAAETPIGVGLGRGAVRRSDRRHRPGHVGAQTSRRASWSATSTPTSRSTGPATPCT